MSIPLQDLTKTGAGATSNPLPASGQGFRPANAGGNAGGAGIPGHGPIPGSGPGAGSPGVGPAQELPGWRFALLGLGLSFGLFLAMLDTSIVAICLYSIAADFQTMESINWVALSYTLSYLGCAVLFARISDIVGRRAAFMYSFVIFIAFSFACGFARTLLQLIVLRAFQGIGGSGLYSLTIVTFPEVTPTKWKRHIATIVGLVIAVSGLLGPILGGVLTQWQSWHWVFWINGPIGCVAAVVFWFAWPTQNYLPDMQRRRWRDVDYFSSFLLIAGSVLIVFAFQTAGLKSNPEPWSAAVFWWPLGCGMMSVLLLFLWEFLLRQNTRGRRLATAIPLDLVSNRVYCFAILHSLLLGFAYMLCIYTFPLRFQVVYHKSPLQSGLMLLPMLGAAALGSIAAGPLNHNSHNRLCETLMAASLFMLIGCALETLAQPVEDLEPKVLGLLTFIGLGFGLSASASTMLCAAESSMREHATGQGINAQLRILGGSMGIAASTAIQASYSHSQLSGILAPEQVANLAGQATTLSAIEYAAVRVAYTDALRLMMKVCCAVLAGAVVLTSATYSRDRMNLEATMTQRNLEEEQRRAEERQEELSP